jgi:hypothetical protein
MFERRDAKSMNFVNPIDLDAITIASIVRNNPILPESVKNIRMPENIRTRMQEAWSKFTGPVKNKNDFQFSLNLHESRHGLIIGLVKYEHGKFDVGFVALQTDDSEDDEEDFDDADQPIELFESIANRNPPADEITWLDEVWIPFDPVKQIIRTEKIIMPNDPCSCGSGRKYKKCCGRLA